MLYLYLQAIKNKTAHGAVIPYSANLLAKEFFVSLFIVSSTSFSYVLLRLKPRLAVPSSAPSLMAKVAEQDYDYKEMKDALDSVKDVVNRKT